MTKLNNNSNLLRLCNFTMKKRITSILFEALFCGFLFCFNSVFSQDSFFIKGVVLDEISDMPLENVSITIKSTNVLTYSNSKGSFQLEGVKMDTVEILFELFEYQTIVLPVEIKDGVILDLGTILMKKVKDDFTLSNVVVLNENDFSDENMEGSDNITGFLQASKDVFVRTAAFNFGQARFRIRGYDSNERQISLNGIRMNKFLDGRPQWSNWGGLNDVLRNQNIVKGIEAGNNGTSLIGGSIDFNTKAASYRKGTSASLALANGSYQTRLLFSHFSGVQKNNWSYALSFSTRLAKSGFVDGTNYKAWSGFLSVGKQFNKKHSLNITTLFTPNKRGKSSPFTKEIFELKGNKYNAYWGEQNGGIRNSRLKIVSEPIVMLSHEWKVSPKFEIESVVSYQAGFISNSRLGYQNAANPSPIYYKYLPSYFLRFPENPNNVSAYLSEQEFLKNGQVNWSELYEANKTTNYANYYLFEDRNEDHTLSINTMFHFDWKENMTFSGGVSFQKTMSDNYAKVVDVLGTNGFIDLDTYSEGDKAQNNLNYPNRLVGNGAKFSYNYSLISQRVNLFSQLVFSQKYWEGFVSGALEKVTYLRNGIYKNGAYPENSFGKGNQIDFLGFHFKAGGVYKYSGRNLIKLNIGYLQQPPYSRNVFTNVRYNHNIVPKIRSENKFSTDVSYEFRSPKLKVQCTGYFTNFYNGSQVSFTYADGLKNDEADFVSQILSGIDKRHVGVEFGLEWKPVETVKLFSVAAIGDFTFQNNPDIYIESDLYQSENSEFGKTYLKNFKIAGTPQKAYSLGFEYRSPDYWWFQVNGNLMMDNFIQIAPLIRTKNFFTDADGVPVIDVETGNEITQHQVSELWNQEEYPDLFLLNLVGGKSWKIKERYLGLFLSFNNLLNTVYKTGGFEQSRNANYENFITDKNRDKPLFGSKYWYSQGVSYYLILSYRF